MHLSALNVYPIKSVAGIALDEAIVEGRGLQHDRRWMLIDSSNRFISQREQPILAIVGVEVFNDRLRLSVTGHQPLEIPFDYQDDESESVQIWNDVCSAKVVSDAANRWFSELTGEACRLVHMDQTSERPVDRNFARNGDMVSFADAYPFLLLGEASVADLNGRLSEPVPMNRFRPNLVVSGSEAFAEDDWKLISIGETLFHVVKPCARCVMTTVDQEKGIRSGIEPLYTLSTYRKSDANKVLFGQNLLAANTGGKVRVGDEVKVLEKRS